MKYYAAISAMIAALLISSFLPLAFAADLQAFLVPERDRTTQASFVGVRTITFQYAAGSAMAQEFSGKNERVSFTLNGTASQEQDATGMRQVINSLNKGFAAAQSPVQASSADLSYTATLRGTDTRATLAYKVELKPVLEKFVLATGQAGQSGFIVDLEWRGVDISDPLVVKSPQNGEIDINHPIGLLQASHPAIAEQLLNSPAREIMTDSILNFEDFNTPMGSWHRLFDPVGAYGGGVGLEGTEGAKALTVYSLGESSIREGAHTTEEKDATATVDGSEVKVHSQNPPPSGQITFVGYSNNQESNGNEFAIVTADSPEGVVTSSGGFPIQVLLVFGGMMGAIAIFILFKARK